MSSSKKNNDQNGGSTHESREPDETTRLLPRHPPPNNDGYLSPDDPAVSPYNLWMVRFSRYLTVLFLAVTFVWWTLLLVSTFVSPPSMNSRGSGFFDFSYTTLTIGNLLVVLLFFSSPSQAMRISSAVLSVILLVDMIMILAVGRLKSEEGWVGIVSVVWAALMSMWCILTDRIVEWGKREEEERLTGRPETRRTLKEWLSVLITTTSLVVYIVIAVLLTGTLILRARDASLEMQGERYSVDGDKYAVHFACVGDATRAGDGKRLPTVLLEAGEHPSEHELETWLHDGWLNGTVSRYCYWDRPGYAWSDNAPSPHSAGMSATALSETLARAGEEGPWILVSAGYGSIVSRIFSSVHSDAVVGIMMVDPLHEDLLHRIGDSGRGFLLWARGVISPLGIMRIPEAIFKGRNREDRVYGRSAFQSGKLIKARLQENLVADSLTKNEVVAARTIQPKKTPVVVVSSGINCRSDREWEVKQEDLTRITETLLDWVVVNKAPHEVWKTAEGRKQMEKGLAKLVKAAK